MKKSNVQFMQLQHLLEGMGFVTHKTERGWLFEHAASGAELTFRAYRPNDQVYEHHLVAVKSQLDWRGLMSPDAFDHVLAKTPA